MAVDRGARDDNRQRRALQKLAADPFGTLGFIAGPGIAFDPNTKTISILVDPVIHNLASVSAAGLKAIGPLTTKGDVWTWDTTNARLGVGTDGQVLTVNSATPTGLEWTDVAFPLTTKGDIFVFSTQDDRLPVGNVGQVLTPDPAAATGLRWTDISADVSRRRFIQPFRIRLGNNVTTSINGNTLVVWLLVAGSKPLHIKKISIGASEHKGAAAGSNAHRLSIRRFWFPNILQLSTSSTSISVAPAVCLSDADQISSALTCMSGGSTGISTSSTLLGSRLEPFMGGMGLQNCNTSNAVRRIPAKMEWANADDSDIMVVPAMSGILIQCGDTATGEAWPQGYVEWEE